MNVTTTRFTTGVLNKIGKHSVRFASAFEWLKNEKVLLAMLMLVAALVWMPRLNGPLDLRWDGGVYYVLGTSIAEGKGYRLLNEPGEISAVQYPPLLPLIIAGYQKVLGTSDTTIVGGWLRFSAILLFFCYVYAIFRLSRQYLSALYAFLTALLSVLSLHVYFLSDLCFPEILFSFTTILFFLWSKKEDKPRYAAGTYLLAVAAYALRTIGIAVLIIWVLDSLLKRRFKQVFVRLAFAIVPVFCWQFYIASVEKSYDYNHPAYSYQRAPYLFYNVTYSRNIALEDPFAPERGKANVVQRVISNVTVLPVKLGESVATPYYSIGVWKFLHSFIPARILVHIISAINVALLYILSVLVLAGLILQVWKRQLILPLFTSANLSAICLTPFLAQYLRYLMPITPFLILSLMICLLAIKNAAVSRLSSKWYFLRHVVVLSPVFFILFLELTTYQFIHETEFKAAEYVDLSKRRIRQKMFYRAEEFNSTNLCIDYIRRHARPTDVIASGMPHWIYLVTGLKSVMPPFEINCEKAQQELDSVPVEYIILGKDVIDGDRYTFPVIEKFPDKWKKVFSTSGKDWMVYQRINR